MIDSNAQIAAVNRSTGEVDLEVGKARSFTVAQTFGVPVERLWEACATARGISSWFLPISGDLQLYGEYQLEGNASGQITTCDPLHEYTATWIYSLDRSTVDVRFASERAESSTLTLEHDIPIAQEVWEKFGPGGVGIGWDLTLMSLATHLATGEPLSPEDNLAFAKSDEGRRFLALSADEWATVAEDSGTRKHDARRAAENARTSYEIVEDEQQ
ncbi:polyketide cyclase [Rhodococcus sp. HNM0569]|uniref:polyketide cyclase n=1 Tax=Rhodococcus sp. HNM0569 TaxID=2716340 RepID=UPI001469FFBE|nr:polyketide cyclase [Rhodococcus sp. HNM0569]NLU83231.1 polyketide cyclase [Rhodococcus sp. HNM0569]